MCRMFLMICLNLTPEVCLGKEREILLVYRSTFMRHGKNI
jgi:hypothetical protein